MKTEKTQVHFLSDVLVALLDLKVPNKASRTPSVIFVNNKILIKE